MPAALPVESSWRMVEGDHDSFDTSIVPLDESGQPSLHSPDSQDSQETTQNSEETTQNSQDDDLAAFLRRADVDEDGRVLLRSPFQPSLLSSARQSPLGMTRDGSSIAWQSAYRTPEPTFHMPLVDVDLPSTNETDLAAPQTTDTTSRARQTSPFTRLLLLAALGALLLAATRGIPCALAPRCYLPAVAWLDLAVCARPPESTPRVPERVTRTAASNLSDDATALMHVQTHLADVARVYADAGGSAAEEAWMLARTHTRDVQRALQASRTDRDKRLLQALDAYLNAVQPLSLALARFQTGLAAAVSADTLVHATYRTLAQVQRMSTARGRAGSHQAVLLDAYRRHAAALAAKTDERAGEAEAVRAALAATNKRLAPVRTAVAARWEELWSAERKTERRKEKPAERPMTMKDFEAPGLLRWLRILLGAFWDHPSESKESRTLRQWREYTTEMFRLQEWHGATTKWTAEAVAELADVQQAVRAVQRRLAGHYTQDVDVPQHVSILEAGMEALERRNE